MRENLKFVMMKLNKVCREDIFHLNILKGFFKFNLYEFLNSTEYFVKIYYENIHDR